MPYVLGLSCFVLKLVVSHISSDLSNKGESLVA